MKLRDPLEWKTLILTLSVYAAWIGVIYGSSEFPGWLTFFLLTPVITLHSSLQHECIHGHPFENQLLNDLLVFLPLGLFLPYLRYKELHLTHHQKASITDPTEDPESWYLTGGQWQRLAAPVKLLFRLNNTLIGRLLLGPLLGTGSMIIGDFIEVLKGDRNLIRIWSVHVLFSCAILSLVAYSGAVSILLYVVSAYAGMSVLMIRTYLEHQSHTSMRARSVIIEDRGLLAFLFLNNNLHAIHHAYPTVAWYQLPRLFKRNRQQFLDLNKGYHYDSYIEVIKKFSFHQKEPVVYPIKTRIT